MILKFHISDLKFEMLFRGHGIIIEPPVGRAVLPRKKRRTRLPKFITNRAARRPSSPL